MKDVCASIDVTLALSDATNLLQVYVAYISI